MGIKSDNTKQGSITKACKFAIERHKGAKDDAGELYFFSHILKVAKALQVLTNDKDIIIAGALHDLIEDTETTYQEIKERFGERVANLVMEVTEEGTNFFPRLKSPEAVMIKLVDRASNVSRMSAWNEERKKYYIEKCRFWKKKKDEPNGAVDNYVKRPNM